MNSIETRNLSYRYGQADAVRDLNLAIPAGSSVALLGPNGAGKTTTIKLLLGLLEPATGEARVMGIDSRKLTAREIARIGYVTASSQPPLWMTVRQLLDYHRPFYPRWDVTLEQTLLAQFGLPEHRPLQQLSHGMLRKAVLLSSLAYRPDLLILDEPLSGLDAVMREEFIRGVLETAALGEWTMVLASHDLEDIERLADHVAILEHGRLVVNEPTHALQNRFRRVELTDAPTTIAAPSGALDWERAGTLTRFVATDYAGVVTDRAWAQRWPGATIQAQPLSLREIFITLNRSHALVTAGNQS